ncbi:VOC family protein [Aeromicrobium sp. UC242_57]|uniref:VOC family protein n=1 Tax=Aeromicrobium sp. UC242_57 TaxID=3374624 RepID=UPI0037959F31
MSQPTVVVSLPISDRRTSHDFYTRVLGYPASGPLAGDGVPEPLQLELADGVNLMLVPTGGFAWVIGDHQVAAPGHSECLFSLTADSAAAVDG